MHLDDLLPRDPIALEAISQYLQSVVHLFRYRQQVALTTEEQRVYERLVTQLETAANWCPIIAHAVKKETIPPPLT